MPEAPLRSNRGRATSAASAWPRTWPSPSLLPTNLRRNPPRSSRRPVTTTITVSLRSLVAVMPDQYFVCPRTDLWRRIDLDTRIALPSDLVVPQLKIARVRLPLAVAVGLMPRSILASPLPSISDETIPIALQEIVPQLPVESFRQSDESSRTSTRSISATARSRHRSPRRTSRPATVEIRAPEPRNCRPASSARRSRKPRRASRSFVRRAGRRRRIDFRGEIAVTEPAAVEPTPTPRASRRATSPPLWKRRSKHPHPTEPTTVEPVAEGTPSQAEVDRRADIRRSSEDGRTSRIAAEPSPAAEQPVVEPVAVEPIAEVVTPAPVVTEPRHTS